MDLMIDIETLGTERKSVICSVGWALFDDEGINEHSIRRLPWGYQLKQLGRTVRENTLKWWLEQSKAAQFQLVHTGPECCVDRLHDLLLKGIKRNDVDRVWANGPRFDLDLLEDLFSDVHMVKPWIYKQERDYRTIRDVGELLGITAEETGTAHNAEDDAVNQAKLVIAVRKALKNTQE